MSLNDAERVKELEAAIEKMDTLAEAGMCYFSNAAKHAYLKDIRREAKRVGLQGGLSEFTE